MYIWGNTSGSVSESVSGSNKGADKCDTDTDPGLSATRDCLDSGVDKQPDFSYVNMYSQKLL